MSQLQEQQSLLILHTMSQLTTLTLEFYCEHLALALPIHSQHSIFTIIKSVQ